MEVATLMNRVWERLLPQLEALRNLVVQSRPSSLYQLGRHATEVFPLTGYASFSLAGDPQAEDIAVSASCRLEAGLLECRSDIATGTGFVLADGPSAEIDLALVDEPEIERRLNAWIDAVGRFLDEGGATLDPILDRGDSL